MFVFDYSKALHVYLSDCAIQKTRVVVLGTGTRLDYILQGKRYGPRHHWLSSLSINYFGDFLRYYIDGSKYCGASDSGCVAFYIVATSQSGGGFYDIRTDLRHPVQAVCATVIFASACVQSIWIDFFLADGAERQLDLGVNLLHYSLYQPLCSTSHKPLKTALLVYGHFLLFNELRNRSLDGYKHSWQLQNHIPRKTR